MPRIQVIFGDEKRCGSCKELKPLQDFPKAKTKSGYYCYCKSCANTKNQSAFKRHRTKVLKRIIAYRATATGRKVARKAYARQRAISPEKISARQEVKKAILRGDLVKPLNCEEALLVGCGGRLEAHHSDYSKPLEVRWLCKYHHTKIHQLNRLSERSEEANPTIKE